MNLKHYSDVTPNFNDPNWKTNQMPKPNDVIYASYRYYTRPALDEGQEVEIITTIVFVARINLGGTFTVYWSDGRAASLGAQLDTVRENTRIDDITWVALYGLKVWDEEQAAKVFPILVRDYGLTVAQ